MTIVKPFALAVGDYLELEDHRFLGPLAFETPNVFSTSGPRHPEFWNRDGVQINGTMRVRNILKGPVSINAYIDRMAGSPDHFINVQIERARAALRLIASGKPVETDAPGAPPSIGALADTTIQAMMTKIVTDVLLPEIRKIVAEEVEAMALNTRRFVVTVENHNARRG